MRPTGFGHRSPKDATADYIYPIVDRDGKCLEMGFKTISDQRREIYYMHKLSGEDKETDQLTLDQMPRSMKDFSDRKSGGQGSSIGYSSTKNVRQLIDKVG